MEPVLLQTLPIPFSAYLLCFFPLATVVFGLITFFVLTDRHATRPYLRYNAFKAATVPPAEAAAAGPATGETPAGPLGSPGQTTTVYTGGRVGDVVRVRQGEQPPPDAPADYQPSFEGTDQGIGHTRADDAPPRPGDANYPAQDKNIAEVQPGPIDEPTLTSGGEAITSAFEGLVREPATDPNAAQSKTTITNVRPGIPTTPPAGTSRAAAQRVTISHIEHSGSDAAAEYVQLTNNGTDPVDMTGWMLSDEGQKHTFTFVGFVLAPGESVRVWSGDGVNDQHNLYWQNRSPIWNNAGDTVLLNDVSGAEIHRQSYQGPRR